MNFGFVGYGNMGGTLLNAFLDHGAVSEVEVIVSNRTMERLDGLKKAHPGVKVVSRCADVACADIIFLCVRTGDVRATLEQMLPLIDANAHIVTINGGLQIKNLERIFPGKITKAIPSMTMGSGHGVTLICHNGRVDADQASEIEGLFSQVGTVQVVAEEQFEVAADLTSCAPAFIADIVQRFVEAGLRHSDLDPEEARQMMVETLLGTALTLSSSGVTFDGLKKKVATKGGISEQGLAVLDRELPGMFDRVLEATVSKHAAVKGTITRQFDK